YAAVNSHVLIAGPLHGALLTEWTDGNKGWRWVRHDLTAYAGRRAHLEFSPSGQADLEVAAVVEADREPPRVERPGGPIVETLCTPGTDSPERLAGAYQALFAEALRRMEADEPGEYASLADFLLRRPDLFGGDAARRATDEEFGRLRAAEE